MKGRVQGVGFRYFVSQTARSLGVLGEVWNRRDGGVEVIAEHEEPMVLVEFENLLWEGPGYVHAVLGEESTGSFSDFKIGYSR